MMKAKRMFGYSILISSLILSSLFTAPGASQVQDVSLNRASTSKVGAQQSHSAQSQGRQPDDSEDVERVEANLVTVPASVMDRDGRYVTDLRREDFQIFEDGTEQEVSFFAPVEQPFTILFLVDTSSSMLPHMAGLADAANALAGQLRPNDRLIAATFYKTVDVLFQATKVSELHKGIKLKPRRDSDCSTMIYDAVDDALKRMKKIRGRKAIVLFSDGVGIGTFASAKSTLREAEEQEALIYTVQFGSFPDEPLRGVDRQQYLKRVEEINGYMRDLAQKTGGRYYQVENLSDLGKTFGSVAEELRRQYSLGYYPKKGLQAGERREVKVRVRRSDIVVRARDSYVVEVSKQSRQP